MSEFDKEAEREKLREKYERDSEKRKATQRMSDLLLKGATMTNRHCDTCGDPIFRYDGQEFCPTCQAEGRVDSESVVEGAQGGQEAEEGSDTASTAERDTVASAERTATTAGEGRSNESQPDSQVTQNRSPSTMGTNEFSNQSSPAESEQTPAVGSAQGTVSPIDGTLTDAQDSLVRSVVKFSTAAEQTDDPRQAKDALAAAREAAEALEALRR